MSTHSYGRIRGLVTQILVGILPERINSTPKLGTLQWFCAVGCAQLSYSTYKESVIDFGLCWRILGVALSHFIHTCPVRLTFGYFFV